MIVIVFYLFQSRVFQIVVRGGARIQWGDGGGSEILLGENIFLPGKGNLRRSDFDDLNLFQR